MKRGMSYLIHVVLPIALGSCIYVGWRSTDLWVFQWIDAVGVTHLVVRPGFPLPGWALYSLPDGCWVYAYTSWMLLLWGRMSPWAYAGVSLGLGSEFGQLFGFVPGTYDNLDVVFYIGAFILSGVFHTKKTPVVCGGHDRDGSFGLREQSDIFDNAEEGRDKADSAAGGCRRGPKR
jgi:hypothetical protein